MKRRPFSAYQFASLEYAATLERRFYSLASKSVTYREWELKLKNAELLSLKVCVSLHLNLQFQHKALFLCSEFRCRYPLKLCHLKQNLRYFEILGHSTTFMLVGHFDKWGKCLLSCLLLWIRKLFQKGSTHEGKILLKWEQSLFLKN